MLPDFLVGQTVGRRAGDLELGHRPAEFAAGLHVEDDDVIVAVVEVVDGGLAGVEEEHHLHRDAAGPAPEQFEPAVLVVSDAAEQPVAGVERYRDPADRVVGRRGEYRTTRRRERRRGAYWAFAALPGQWQGSSTDTVSPPAGRLLAVMVP